MPNKPSVLFLTNSELGQAAVHLAVAFEFLIRGNYKVHIASFAPLDDALDDLHRRLSLLPWATARPYFHRINGPSMVEFVRKKTGVRGSFKAHPVGLCGAIRTYKSLLLSVVMPWDGIQYMEIYRDCEQIIQQVQPVVAVVDPLLIQAVDVCRTLGQCMVKLGPNTVLSHVRQPYLANLWKYPILCSGYSYPLPWYLLLPNAYLGIRLGRLLSSCKEFKEVEEYRNRCGIPGPLPSMLVENTDKTPFVLPSMTYTDFPCHTPEQFTLCGPILRPSAPISQETPELARWVSRRPTILITMGSHLRYNSDDRRQFAEGLRMLLDQIPRVQILWKMVREHEPGVPGDDKTDPALACLHSAIETDSVRIEPWLYADPIAILESGLVVCMVHHGGANSYHEAIKAGIPQVVIPVWFDTYEYAARVKYLDIGVWVRWNHSSTKNGKKLANALLHVVQSTSMQIKAMTLAVRLGPVEGRVVAWEKIDSILGEEKARNPFCG